MKSVSPLCAFSRDCAVALPNTWLADLLPNDAAAFLAAVNGTRLDAVWHLAASGKLRIAELLALRWTDIDWDGRSIGVRNAIVGVPYAALAPSPMAPQARVVGLSSDLAERLRAHCERQSVERSEWGAYYKDHDLVVCRQNGAPLHSRTLFDVFSDVAERVRARQVDTHSSRAKREELSAATRTQHGEGGGLWLRS
jgi:integrase